MHTDVTLHHDGRQLIIDAKYYGRNLQTGRFGKVTIYSAHIYQLLAYVKNADTRSDGSVSGLLLYARTTGQVQPDLDVMIGGNRFRAATIDLDQPWTEIAAQLDGFARW